MSTTPLASPYLRDDTIVAAATAPGHGAVALVRVSGPGTQAIVQQLCGREQPLEARRATLCRLQNPATGEHIDQALVTFFAGPGSYSGQDMAEIGVHGNPRLAAEVVEACVQAGARVAEPGEFTFRAWCHGRVSLAQAEAIDQLIRARSRLAAAAALRTLEQGLGALLGPFRERLTEVRVHLEAAIEFPTDEVEELAEADLQANIAALLAQAREWLVGCAKWEQVSRGWTVTLLGPPNVGKSSLYNRLLGYARALVTDIPGTTRDTLEEQLELEGLPLRLIDTAGLGEAQDELDRMGMERSRQAAQRSDLWVVVVEAPGLQEQQVQEFIALKRRLAQEQGVPLLLVGNKCDRLPSPPIPEATDVWTSALEGTGIEELAGLIAERLRGLSPGSDEPGWMATVRQRQTLQELVAVLERARENVAEGEPLELVATDMQEAHQLLDQLDGTEVPTDIIAEVFGRFCIGK